MEIMEVCGRSYPVIGYVESKTVGAVPLLDIPMMSDYKWQQRALCDRLEHQEKYIATGEDVEATISSLRAWLKEHNGEASA